MQFNTFVSSVRDLERCVNAPNLQEVLLEPMLLARQGKLSETEVQKLASEAVQRGLRPVLVWDALMPEKIMAKICDRGACAERNRLMQWDLSCFGAIRACDPGAAYWLKTYFPQMPLHLIVETGNHNLEALRGWCDIFSGSLERLVLSIELPEDKLIEYCQKLPVACELLGVGQILLFYSPRSLLAEHFTASSLYLEATAAFTETPNRQLPTLETAHGTFMFLDKDQFILDKLDALRAANLHTVRLDLRHLSREGDVAVDVDTICRQILSDPAALRKTWTRETRAPFFKANRTTALFPRMKSKLTEYRNNATLAEVLAGESGKYVVFYTLRSFDAELIESMMLPTGEEIEVSFDVTFRNLDGEILDAFDAEQILVTNWIKKAMPGSLLLGKDSS